MLILDRHVLRVCNWLLSYIDTQCRRRLSMVDETLFMFQKFLNPEHVVILWPNIIQNSPRHLFFIFLFAGFSPRHLSLFQYVLFINLSYALNEMHAKMLIYFTYRLQRSYPSCASGEVVSMRKRRMEAQDKMVQLIHLMVMENIMTKILQDI